MAVTLWWNRHVKWKDYINIDNKIDRETDESYYNGNDDSNDDKATGD